MTDRDLIETRINGEPRRLPGGLDVAGMLRELGLEAETVVVERNGEILRRAEYADVPVRDGDVYELVHFVGGGSDGG